MKVSVGADIVDIARFRQRTFKRNTAFYENVFSKGEIAYCLSTPDPPAHFAARFAAKEAIIKAVPALKNSGMAAIEICRGTASVSVKVGRKGVCAKDISVSLSHVGEYALACAAYNYRD